MVGDLCLFRVLVLLRIVLLILVVVGLLVLRGVCFVGLVGWLWVVVFCD